MTYCDGAEDQTLGLEVLPVLTRVDAAQGQEASSVPFVSQCVLGHALPKEPCEVTPRYLSADGDGKVDEPENTRLVGSNRGEPDA